LHHLAIYHIYFLFILCCGSDSKCLLHWGQDVNGRLLTVNKAAPRGARPEEPAPRELEPSFRIYVGNFSWQVDDARLEQVFSEHGKVPSARVVYDRETGRSRGFGFVTMATQTELDDAIAALDGQVRLVPPAYSICFASR